jgi:hypothetical protein
VKKILDGTNIGVLLSVVFFKVVVNIGTKLKNQENLPG